MTKCVFTLSIDDYAPSVVSMTRPFLTVYAEKIGAELREITERKWPHWPVVYEKLQIHELGRAYDWSIYFDGDALIHPDLFDVTTVIGKDTVMQNAKDMAGNRFACDQYFLRDGRHIGACNWFTVASDWCLDLWRPSDEEPENVISRIHAISQERKAGITDDHLVDDYMLSQNIARFGLKHRTLQSVLTDLGRSGDEYFWHCYTMSTVEKVVAIKETIKRWGL